MLDLLHFTKKIAQRIQYYDAIIDFSEETHWFNPFYKQHEITVVWVEPDNNQYK